VRESGFVVVYKLGQCPFHLVCIELLFDPVHLMVFYVDDSVL